MRILITNDDGINAKGIIAIARELSKTDEIIVVAPREQKSASSHSISIHEPLKVKEEIIEGINCKAYSIVGTPADCTQIGITLLCGKIDLVVSGINRGLNCGIDILYSGTVSAAAEACIYGVPAIALSMDVDWDKNDEEYNEVARYAATIINSAKNKYLRNDVVLNINMPNLPEKDIKGLKVCKIGKSTYQVDYILIEDSDDKVYKVKSKKNKLEETDTDSYFVSQGYATLTPLHFDFTNFNILEEVEGVFKD